MNAQAKDRKAAFLVNVTKSDEVNEYKTKHLDPVAARLIAQVNRNVALQAAQLRQDYLEDLCLTDWHMGKTVGTDENVDEGEGEKMDAQDEGEGSKADEDEVASPSSAAFAEEMLGMHD